MTEKNAYDSFCYLAYHTTGCSVKRYDFMVALQSFTDNNTSIEAAVDTLSVGYTKADQLLPGDINWTALTGVSSSICNFVLWAVFLRKAHNEEKDRSMP